MPYDRFLITPFKSGLETLMKPWQIAEDAFTVFNNAYVFRGRVRKRSGGRLMGTTGSQILSRLRISVGTTDGAGNLSGTVPGNIFSIGQMFSIGMEIYTVYQSGVAMAMLDTGATTTATYDTTNGNFVFVGATPGTPVFFYPAEPVMGFTNYEVGPVNNQPSYAFDTQFVYLFTNGWARSGTALWRDPGATKSNFFWSANWEGVTPNVVVLFVTNFQVTNPNGAGVATDDPIWYTVDGSNWTAASGGSANGFYFLPAGGIRTSSPFIQTARIIVAFKNRLVLLNTIENNNGGGFGTNTAYPNRCRFSHNGSPLSANAWYEPNQVDSAGNRADGAGFIDATTEEQIVTAEFIKDRLIVYFERSTWELAYTGNEVLPFVWQKINTELGSESTFSSVPFDRLVLAIGNTGVHSCNGANTQRIDSKIPDQVFKINLLNQGVKRVAGIRDYFEELVYWTLPGNDLSTTQIFPNRVLVYNYQNDSWAYNDDCITAFGYFEQEQDTTWATDPNTWEQSDEEWSSGILQAQSRQVIAGNQEGYTFLVDDDINRNAPVMQITNITGATPNITIVIVNHMLNPGDYIAVENTINGITPGIYQITSVINLNTVTVIGTFTGTYTGGGQATRISVINILSKQWNPYVNDGRNVYLAKIDFGVNKTTNGQVFIDYFPSSSDLSMVTEGEVSGSIMGNGVLETTPYDVALYPLEQVQELLWHPIYFQSDGEFIQIQISLTPTQILNTDIIWSDFEMEGLVLHTQPTRNRLE